MPIKWTDSDSTFEGVFTLDEFTWRLDADHMADRFKWNGKTLQKIAVYVPNLTGVITQTWEMFGRTFFRGLIDLPNAPVSRSEEVFGSYSENQATVQINLFGNIFNIAGWIDQELSGAEISGLNTQGN